MPGWCGRFLGKLLAAHCSIVLWFICISLTDTHFA